VLELSEPLGDRPVVELVELTAEEVELVLLDEVEPVDAVAELLMPGTVAASTAAKTPREANANIATPAVSWLIRR
jgi:hypothetical protein